MFHVKHRSPTKPMNVFVSHGPGYARERKPAASGLDLGHQVRCFTWNIAQAWHTQNLDENSSHLSSVWFYSISLMQTTFHVKHRAKGDRSVTAAGVPRETSSGT